jgi:hypothetical protein
MSVCRKQIDIVRTLFADSLTHSLTRPLTHLLAHSFTYWLAHLLAHLLAHSLAHSLDFAGLSSGELLSGGAGVMDMAMYECQASFGIQYTHALYVLSFTQRSLYILIYHSISCTLSLWLSLSLSLSDSISLLCVYVRVCAYLAHTHICTHIVRATQSNTTTCVRTLRLLRRDPCTFASVPAQVQNHGCSRRRQPR